MAKKMAFFDLNIPVGAESKDDLGAQSLKESRLKRVVKAMELGYSGIAYNLFVLGVLADSHRSSITPLPLPSLLEASPSLAETVKFHRLVLGVPVGDTFRQYSRITVGVDSMLQAASVNPNHPVLRTYDLVAVHPKNQEIFDHACRKLEVDLISIDFSRKLSLHMTFSAIRAAVERGVFFEIMYSPAISNLDARREIFKQVQILVEWTRGTNIIISSASQSVNTLRGPYDVLNMSTLFGLSTEHAKATISKNCRSLILRGLTRKNCYKLAIQVKKHSPDGIIGSHKAWFDASKVWDPISSGKGDVILKANLDSNDRLDEKEPLSRAKKRRRRSGKSKSIASGDNSALMHQNTNMKIDTGAPILGLRLKETKFALDTKVMPNSKTTALEFDTCMKEKNFKIEKFIIPQTTLVSKNNANFSNAMESLPLEDKTCREEQNLRIEKITVPMDTAYVDDRFSISKSVESLPLDDYTCRKEQISRIENQNINVPQVTRDGNNDFSFSSDLEFLALDDNTCMKEQNPRIEKVGVPQATGDGDDNSSFSGAMGVLPIDDNTCMKERNSSMEEISIPQSSGDGNNNSSVAIEFLPLEDSTCMKEQNYRIQEISVPQLSTVGNNNSSLARPKDCMPFDDNAYQPMATGIGVTLCQKDVVHVEDASQVIKYRSSTNKNTESSPTNCNSHTNPDNYTSITPPIPSSTGVNSPSKTGVHKDPLEMWKGTSLISDDGRDLTNRKDSIYNNFSQVEILELKPCDTTSGVKVEQADTADLGPDTEVDGFKFEANERHSTEPTVQKAMDTLPTIGVGELSAACANDDEQMKFTLQTSKGRKIRKATVNSLTLRGVLKSGLIKKKVPSRKGASSRTNSRKR